MGIMDTDRVRVFLLHVGFIMILSHKNILLCPNPNKYLKNNISSNIKINHLKFKFWDFFSCGPVLS